MCKEKKAQNCQANLKEIMTKQFSELTQENLQTQEAHAKAGQPIGEYQKQQEHLKSN